MLEPWIIEQIRRREEEQRRQNERPRLEIPARDERHDERNDHWRKREQGDETDKGEDGEDREGDRKKEDDPPNRGVMIIDFGVG